MVKEIDLDRAFIVKIEESIDFTTILLAPNSFIDSNADQVKYFETIISYEELGEHISLFKESLK